jgi:hypothetical protein
MYFSGQKFRSPRSVVEELGKVMGGWWGVVFPWEGEPGGCPVPITYIVFHDWQRNVLDTPFRERLRVT